MPNNGACRCADRSTSPHRQQRRLDGKHPNPLPTFRPIFRFCVLTEPQCGQIIFISLTVKENPPEGDSYGLLGKCYREIISLSEKYLNKYLSYDPFILHM